MIELYNEDNKDVMARLPNESIDVICIDPPYLYLKNQKLERPFDEKLFFSECKRLLTTNGFIVMFGRGESFYRWNTMLADLGFIFKEEIVWNKSQCSSPLMPISRVHETISVYAKGKGKINKVKVPYLEIKKHDINSIIQDVRRMRSIFTQAKSMKAVLDFLENNEHGLNEKTIVRTDRTDCENFTKFGVNADQRQTGDRCANVLQSVEFGLNEKSIIRTDLNNLCVSKNKLRGNCNDGDRCVNVVQSVSFGLNEKSIIKQVRDHYSAIHPTQKPVRLLERLLALVIPDKPKNEIMVADFFGGSFSTMVAVFNMGMNGISCEIDKEYFEAGKQRIESLHPNLFSSEL